MNIDENKGKKLELTGEMIDGCISKYGTENPLEERLVEILQLEGTRPWHHGNEIENISKDGDILIVSVKWDYRDGDNDWFTFKLPIDLLNKTRDEWIAWWKKIEGQKKIASTIKELKSTISSLDEKETSMLDAYRHLQDPEWIHAKLQQVNSAINKNDRKRNEKKQELTEMESMTDPDVARYIVENKRPGWYPMDEIKVLKTTESWRDLCK